MIKLSAGHVFHKKLGFKMWTLVFIYCLNCINKVLSKPIAECCRAEITESIQQLSNTLPTTTKIDDMGAVFFELQQAAIISVERFSLLIAGILMLITTIILIVGTCYMTCFHDEKFKYSAVPQIDFMDEGIRDLESLIHMLSEMGHPLHQTVKHFATEEFNLIKSKIHVPVSNL